MRAYKNLKRILVVEDDPNDQLLLERALGHLHGVSVEFVSDGEQAKEYLRSSRSKGESRAAEPPDIVITDLKMPRCDGFELVNWMRSRTDARNIPVVVLSSSSINKDIERAYALGANTYFVKPAEAQALKTWATAFAEYWRDFAALPGR